MWKRINIYHRRVGNGLAGMGMARIEGERFINEYHFSKELIANSYSSYMVPKFSPLKVNIFNKDVSGCLRSGLLQTLQELLHNITFRLQDSGILLKLKSDALNAPLPVSDPKVRVNQPLSVWQMSTALFIQMTGILLGMLAFFMELGIKKRNKRNTVEVNVRKFVEAFRTSSSRFKVFT